MCLLAVLCLQGIVGKMHSHCLFPYSELGASMQNLLSPVVTSCFILKAGDTPAWRFYKPIAVNRKCKRFSPPIEPDTLHLEIFSPIVAMWYFNLFPGLHRGAF